MNKDIVFGMIGFAGFEALRVYKKLNSRVSVIPKRNRVVYSGILVVLAVFAGACAYALAKNNPASALFIGFSVPNGIRALLQPASPANGVSATAVDDVVVAGGRDRAKSDFLTDYFW
jgi:hypothetical protein